MTDEKRQAYLDALAQEIHRGYCRKHPGAPNDLPWEALPEDVRQANRDQAAAFLEHLDFLGLRAVFGDSAAKDGLLRLTGEQTEQLAERIHGIWMQSKKAAGWTYGPVRDDSRRVHDMLLPYADLPEEEKEKDRDIARDMIPLLEKAGIKVCRQ